MSVYIIIPESDVKVTSCPLPFFTYYCCQGFLSISGPWLICRVYQRNYLAKQFVSKSLVLQGVLCKPLLLAARGGYKDIVEFLLQNGASPTEEDTVKTLMYCPVFNVVNCQFLDMINETKLSRKVLNLKHYQLSNVGCKAKWGNRL